MFAAYAVWATWGAVVVNLLSATLYFMLCLRARRQLREYTKAHDNIVKSGNDAIQAAHEAADQAQAFEEQYEKLLGFAIFVAELPHTPDFIREFAKSVIPPEITYTAHVIGDEDVGKRMQINAKLRTH